MSSSAIRTDLLVARVAAIAIAIVLAATPARAQRPGQGDDESAALVDEGRAALKKGALDAAAKALDQALALNPRRVDAYILRSAVFAARKQYEEGVELMRRAQTLAPTDEEVLTALGSQLVLSGDAAGGVPLLVQVTGKNPARYDAQLLLGHHYHDAGRWPDAITAFEAYFKHRPSALAAEDARHRIELADAYLRFRDPIRALGLFQQAQAESKDALRARMGVAWATAAIDCRKARPLLEKLAPHAEAHPELWLVDGQCALALGDVGGALALGRRYLDRSPTRTAAGHALVGEANAARGNLAEARRAFETARQLEPTRRRWAVRLAVVLRRGGDAGGALASLDQIGPPSQPLIDPDWWVELGETLLAKPDPQGAVTRLGAVATELAGDAAFTTVLGAAQLAAGKAADAIVTLDDAHPDAMAAPLRARRTRLLVEALAAVAAGKLADDTVAAEQLLARADALVAASPEPERHARLWRDLGVARLVLDRPKDAIAPLDRAARADRQPITLMLAARARGQSGDVAGARPLYERALGAEKDRTRAVQIAIDWAASELDGGDPTVAVATLDRVSTKGVDEVLAGRHTSAVAKARHAAGVLALRAGNGELALRHLRASLAASPSLGARCDLALAAVVAGNSSEAIAALRGVAGQTCPFPPPADTQAAPILMAFSEGLGPRRAGKAVDRLVVLAPRAKGATAILAGTALRVLALEAAREAFTAGNLSQARKRLAQARAASSRVGGDELVHDLAVMDLIDGRLDAAIAGFERVSGKLPEALVDLGIAYEKKGAPEKALDAWRRAKKAGARTPNLNDWIDSKERIYGGGP